VIKLNEKNLASITDEMSRLITLVNTIMQYESFENQKLDLKLKDENLPPIIKSLVETHKKRLKENKQKIKAKEIPFLMEKFYQGKDEKSGDIKERGIGVGLSIVKKILDAHDWDVSIKSSE